MNSTTTPEETYGRSWKSKEEVCQRSNGLFEGNYYHNTSLCNEISGINSKTFETLAKLGHIVSLIKDLNVNYKLKILEESIEKYLKLWSTKLSNSTRKHKL